MSNDQPKQQQQPRAESIPVAMLKFSDQYPIDVPGLGGKSSVTGTALSKVVDGSSKRLGTGACWVIDFVPGVRHFRIVYYQPGGGPAVTRMVHEGHVRTWEPLAL